MDNPKNCVLTKALLTFERNSYFAAYYVIMPFYFIVGMLGNIALLIAFYKQSKQDAAYAYQVTLTLSKTFEVFNFNLFFLANIWCAAIEEPNGCTWFMKNYTLMFYAAHISCPVFNGFIIISLLLSVAMSADRVFALLKPFVYKGINHKKHHLAITCICAVIGISTSAFEVNRWQVLPLPGINPKNETYTIRYNEEYLTTPVAVALSQLRSALRIVAVLMLIGLNIVMAVIFKNRNRKVGQMASNDNKDKQRKAAEKSLLILTVYQSILNVFSQTPHSAYSIVAAALPEFDRCYGFVFFPFIDMAIEIADAADFFVILAINKRMRKLVLQLLPCKFKCGQSHETHAVTLGLQPSSSQAAIAQNDIPSN